MCVCVCAVLNKKEDEWLMMLFAKTNSNSITQGNIQIWDLVWGAHLRIKQKVHTHKKLYILKNE